MMHRGLQPGKCPHERQKYFDTTLPCARRDCVEAYRAPSYQMAVRSPSSNPFAATNNTSLGYVRVGFERSGDRWTPKPCIDPTVDQALTDMLCAAGLRGALVWPKPTCTCPGPAGGFHTGGCPMHLHGLVYLKPGEKGSCTEGCVYQGAAAKYALAPVGNMTALQQIQARKPPEPWRPSVDEWDLLPDVDVRR